MDFVSLFAMIIGVKYPTMLQTTIIIIIIIITTTTTTTI